ncbi:glycosyltransferase family 4 protein [Pseudoflavitalea rhizosphaerae]|uniref:glycosyltransferase family 4 protein n=1 Tax=Pseudoflavitalea rhizosphaerae TaxID=1884793 RepID=UPI000F8DBC68|nr:glycosyltransferase family 4 protein [Pseudoflavitalea rhizosphaerae]
MKILHLLQRPQLRGVETFTSQLSIHLKEEGHQPVIVFLYNGKASIPFDGPVYHLHASRILRFMDIRAWIRLARIIREVKPDIVQANAGDTLKFAVPSKLLFRWHALLVFRNASMISLYIRQLPAKFLNRIFFEFPQLIISVSRASAADFTKMFPSLGNKVITLPVGIEGQPMPVDNHLSKPHQVTLIHVGGFTFEKNHLRLIGIFKKLVSIYPGACLQLVGDGPLRPGIEELVIEMGLTENVSFLGAREDARELIGRADLLVLPSIIEGLPAVILEAFYCNTPVVAYDVGGVGEVVFENFTGRLVEKNDEGAFLNAIICVIEDQEATRQMIENARRLVTAGYLNSVVCRSFIEVYNRLITEGNKKQKLV